MILFMLLCGRAVPLCLLSCLLLSAGCGGSIEADYSKLDLVDVSGTVTLDGQPLSGATVVALDIGDEKLQLARDVGAHHAIPSDENAAANLLLDSDG